MNAELSEKHELRRSLGLGLAIVIVLGNVIGSGVFKKVAPMASELNSSGWILICWALGGLFTIFGAVSNAEVASMLPGAGGEYAYYKKIYNRFFSYIYSWSNFAAIRSATIASVAYVFVQSLNSLISFPEILPSLSHWNILGIFYPFEGFSIKLAGILLIIALTWFNSRGLKLGAQFSTLILILVGTGILAMIVGGTSSELSNIPMALSLDTRGHGPVTISAVFTAMLAAFWAYEGWNSIGYLGDEIKKVHRNLPLSIVFGLFVIIGLYLLLNMAYLAVMPVDDVAKISEQDSLIAGIEVTSLFWGKPGVIFVSILICFSTLGCTHATIMTGARTSFAMAREGLFFRDMGTVNREGVPGNALWYQGIWASVLVLSGTFDQLTDMLIFAAFIFYGATTLGVFILRRKMPDTPRPYKVWGYPYIPGIFILFCILLLGNTLYTRPREAILGLVLMLMGIPFYYYFKRKNRLPG